MTAASRRDRPERSVPSSSPRGGDVSRTIRVPWSAASVAEVRKTVVDDLQTHAVTPAVIDEAEIVVSELVSNAIRHARPLADGTLRVHWKVKAGVVEVEVTDGGSESTPDPRRARSGRRRVVGCASSAASPTSGESPRTAPGRPSGRPSADPRGGAATERVPSAGPLGFAPWVRHRGVARAQTTVRPARHASSRHRSCDAPSRGSRARPTGSRCARSCRPRRRR
ncbi:ATP-binding protein [Nostocoides sp. HKS02]|uniref:ATP-binding protein n=1 Tax=Nostocoides sp. HKS02 TaxID=1813880 RepID=UPI00351BD98A